MYKYRMYIKRLQYQYTIIIYNIYNRSPKQFDTLLFATVGLIISQSRAEHINSIIHLC